MGDLTGAAPAPSVPLDGIAGVIEQYAKIDQQIREWTTIKDAIRRQIETMLGDSEAGSVRGQTVVRYLHTTTRRLSTKLIQRRFTEAELSECWVESEGRRFYLLQGEP